MYISTPRTLLSLLEMLKIKMGAPQLEDDFVVAAALEDYISMIRSELEKASK